MESWQHREGLSAESRAPTTRSRAGLQLKDTSVWEAQGRVTAQARGQPQSTGSISDLKPEHKILDWRGLGRQAEFQEPERGQETRIGLAQIWGPCGWKLHMFQ